MKTPSATSTLLRSACPGTQAVIRTSRLCWMGIEDSMLLWNPVDGLRKFKIKTHTLTTRYHPGKGSVTHRLELMLSISSSAGAADGTV
jgi:hypothetical protein